MIYDDLLLVDQWPQLGTVFTNYLRLFVMMYDVWVNLMYGVIWTMHIDAHYLTHQGNVSIETNKPTDVAVISGG